MDRDRDRGDLDGGAGAGDADSESAAGSVADTAGLERAARLYEALEALGELGAADRMRRAYQAEAVRNPPRRAELRADLIDRLQRVLAGAVARGAVASVASYVADADAEVERLCGVAYRVYVAGI